MAFQFPASPTVDQTFTPVAGVTYRWSGTAWHLIAGPGSFITQADADTRYVNVDEAQNTTNRIINGKFAIDQRGAGSVRNLTTAGVNFGYGLDRWQMGMVPAPGQISYQQLKEGNDFTFAITVSVADAAVPADLLWILFQAVENINIADFNFGSAQASPVTLAFDVKSSIAGNYSATLLEHTGLRSYVAPYTVTAPNAWETKVITVPGDTTGAWSNAHLGVRFGLGSGANYYPPAANAWAAGNYGGLSADVKLRATAGATFRLRNVRLYKGSVDFGPDRRLYAEELALCQRYYWKTFPPATVPAQNSGVSTGIVSFMAVAASVESSGNVRFPVTMRAIPAITTFNPDAANAQARNHATNADCTLTTTFFTCESSSVVVATSPAGSALGNVLKVHLTASAEL